MLDYIRGRVVSKSPTRLILEVAGIGYQLHIPLSTFEKIPSHDEVTIFTQLFIKDDQIRIFGFATGEERNLFQLLLSVNGIGPTTAITILSGSCVDDIKDAVAREDARALERIKGVGKKTAERIILELKGIIKDITPTIPSDIGAGQKALVGDAVMALVSLGYGRPVAENAVSEAIRKLGTVDNVEILVREALKYKA
ncbi:MAG: Holliday junction branch migration protein RuvA [Candidatus Brocadia sp.]|jgi:Holliday junction DNA helicase, RuvA subunit|uniref:Holliday junction branch migration complex subunit RuvA n=1 Tax=Candidatus Brocadia fulgida TaxID=380242 RepID=A0A0M2V0G4_9BACT|nr:MAG: holliday junction DNA helicase RuvA [Candidatus Brocadia fulgida]OQZ00055.1 MAG: Holliday junction branch migration protein RuvA [Candidatus Brocadia sp. UTAMX2]UJS19717.1 MAG: Holliday junction branch migration protein RuvA [Candidatus Brocadia sp.]